MIIALIRLEDETLKKIFNSSIDISSIFIPWVLTWFAHSLNDLDMIARIYDYLLSAEPYSIIYVCAGFIIGTRD